MKKIVLVLCVLFLVGGSSFAQNESMYGEVVKADVKMKYVYSFEEALRKSREEKKPIFFNCFADWAIPCHSMNKAVFNDAAFAKWMDQHFVNFFIDVTTAEGRPLADRYKITFMAHYLVLDSNGEILLRVVGGSKLPEFQDILALALSPKTSLAGMNKSYDEGERSPKFLLNYTRVLQLANEDEKYGKVADEYFTKIKKSDWSKKENWKLFSSKTKKTDDAMFQYLLEHKAEFVKNNGQEAVDNKIVKSCFSDVYTMATDNSTYDATKLLNIYMILQKGAVPTDNVIFPIYDIAKYRGEKKIGKMMDVFEKGFTGLDERAMVGLDLSLNELKDLSTEDRGRVVNYLTKKMEKLDGNVVKFYQDALQMLTNFHGISFSDLSFADALKKAKEENKLVFMDCFTSWCGPCKMMSKEVFSQQVVGDFFNAHFINLKVDMEKGEGMELSKKYKIKAYPTMLVLDVEGNVVYKILGGQSVKVFMDKIQRGLSQGVTYDSLQQKYEAGERSTAFMVDYLLTMSDGGDIRNIQEEVKKYMAALKPEERFSAPVWKLYDTFVDKYTYPEFEFLVNNRHKFAESIGEKIVNQKIEGIIFPVMLGYLKGTNNQQELENVQQLVQNAKLPADFSLSILNEIVKLFEKKDISKILDIYENRIAKLQDAHTRLNLDILLNELLKNASAQEKERALTYAKKCEETADPKALNGYKALVQALTK
ncbi:MAG: DUF255 domain-containing protein [Odoribacter sp.]